MEDANPQNVARYTLASLELPKRGINFFEMLILKKSAITAFAEAHPGCKDELMAWHRVVKDSKWAKPNDVKKTYIKASILKRGRVIFDITRNYRLVAHINYQAEIVFIRFIGNHNEYDRIDPHTI